ncbi:MAG TPA: selenide, water dikinase SelD, partial [Desulfobacteraceae bacterium]|nr:selenide, water dikinase SelD [Desulfobacteraceae bacterium]
FGFLGHLAEMVTDSGFGVKIQADRLPIISKALEFAGMGLVPAGAYRNRDFRSSMVDISSSVNLSVQDVLFDPQTSGGLLICVENKIADRLLDELKNKGMDKAAIVGTVLDEPKGRIVVC